MKRIILLCCLSISFSVCFSQQINKKVALLIGISDYNISHDLPCIDDQIDSLETVLKMHGFQVLKGKNLNRKEMISVIWNFSDQLKNCHVALFYFFGHATFLKGDNYLIPTHANIRKEQEVELECINIRRIISEMDYAESKINILIFDACRRNMIDGYKASNKPTGMGTFISPPKFFIAYSAAPNSIEPDIETDHCLYTSALISNLNVPEIDIDKLFYTIRKEVYNKTKGEQIPWSVSSIMNFEFKKSED